MQDQANASSERAPLQRIKDEEREQALLLLVYLERVCIAMVVTMTFEWNIFNDGSALLQYSSAVLSVALLVVQVSPKNNDTKESRKRECNL